MILADFKSREVYTNVKDGRQRRAVELINMNPLAP